MLNLALLLLVGHAPLAIGAGAGSPLVAVSARGAAPVHLGLRDTEARIVRCGTIRQDGLFCGTGSVVARVRIQADGTVGAVTALTGSPEMKRMAEEAVAQWLFHPVTVGGEPREADGIVVIRVSWRDEPADSCDRVHRRLSGLEQARP